MPMHAHTTRTLFTRDKDGMKYIARAWHISVVHKLLWENFRICNMFVGISEFHTHYLTDIRLLNQYMSETVDETNEMTNPEFSVNYAARSIQMISFFRVSDAPDRPWHETCHLSIWRSRLTVLVQIHRKIANVAADKSICTDEKI